MASIRCGLVDHVPNGPTNFAAITTMFPLRLCGGKLLVAVTRERRYGPSRLRVNDDSRQSRGTKGIAVGRESCGTFTTLDAPVQVSNTYAQPQTVEMLASL